MVACSNKDAEVVKLLLTHKTTYMYYVEALDKDHNTALEYTMQRSLFCSGVYAGVSRSSGHSWLSFQFRTVLVAGGTEGEV